MKIFRATEDTKFNIDFSWFEKQGQDVNVLIHKCLTPEQRERVGEARNTVVLDYIDVQTGEVTQSNSMLQLIRAENLKDPTFVNHKTPVFEAAFRIFLLNNNQPLTARELATRMGRRPSDVLNQVGSRIVYNGIRPLVPS